MNGRLSAYDLETGERIYRQRVGSADSFSGSALAADGRLYFVTETGDTFVVRAGREFELLATNESRRGCDDVPGCVRWRAWWCVGSTMFMESERRNEARV